MTSPPSTPPHHAADRDAAPRPRHGPGLDPPSDAATPVAAPDPTGPADLAPPSWTELGSVTAALAQRAAQHDQDASLPHDGIRHVYRAGLLTATVGTAFGGPGGGLADTVRILRTLGAGDPAVALITAMTLFTHAAQARKPHWPPALYAELVADSADRPTLLNALRVEPELGSPARGGLPATTARHRTDHWELTGHKIFSTGAAALRWMLVWARTDEDPTRVGTFLVRTDSPGIDVRPTWDHLGLRASRSDDVVFDAVRVPLDHNTGLLAPGDDPGRDVVTGAWNCLGLTALYLGVARAAQEWLTGFLHERVPTALGAPLATLPRFQTAVGEIDVALGAAERLVAALAEGVDAAEPGAAEQSAGAKVIGTRAAIGAVEQAVALLGNNALSRANPLQRHLRDVLCSRIHTPQDDTVLLATGQAALRRPARSTPAPRTPARPTQPTKGQ
ncbi:acyl-CoA/acyl-ACP dehydrogenase [Yinghuangia sp. ASG 101]|uniref:acyl-CoA dehydrogenase family protein n=1 Tax=Yinghuangia sp. ASG 101 TaxID=2896848 RepID=UPI001E2B3492|nr:acyl-CoA dehydrogenase family protein [Yinghuangia sp. ASG 101]UGQ12128.1 acyl-CoA/acyl-ACP dehydrogenase [Yinghuangia sp. ASG 101]